jgi:3-hydroxybutyryl-CoA dehydrogenase
LASKGRITSVQADAARANLHVSGSTADLPQCALVIEAIREDLADKRALFAALAGSQPAGTLLASNTSSLDIDGIAQGLLHPERVLGLHFFNPPPLMRLVEVIHGKATSHESLNAAEELIRAWGKTTVRCTSTPGFIVNRVARPFYGEAQRMVEAGVADAATIDFAIREMGGFRMGPMELTDLIGQDVNLAVSTSVWEQTGRDERYAPTDFQRRLVADGPWAARAARASSGMTVPATRSMPRLTRSSPPRSPAVRSSPTRSAGRWQCSWTKQSTWSPVVRPAPRTSTRRWSWAPTFRRG